MDEPPTTTPLDGRTEEAPTSDQRSHRGLWVRLLLTVAVITAPLVYIIGQQSPDLAA